MEAFQTVEITKDGKNTGKYHMTRTNGTGTFRLCNHEHGTREEADTCPDVQGIVGGHFPRSDKKTDTLQIAAQDLYDFLFKLVGDHVNSDKLINTNSENVTTKDIRDRLEKLGAALSG